MTRSQGIWRQAALLTSAGAAGFWLANFAISLTPIAAEYRSGLSIAYVPMLFQALLGGVLIGLCVSSVLIRLFDRIPGRSPLAKSLTLSFVALIAITLLVEVPARLFMTPKDALRLFIIGVLINVVRFFVLGLAVGYLYTRLDGRGRN